MRKALLLLVLVLLASMVSVVRATPIGELTSLAEYFPNGTLVYATIRTDEGYFEQVDTLLETLNTNLGGELLPPEFSTYDELNNMIAQETGLDLDALPLGDSISVGVPNLNVEALMMDDFEDFPFIVAIALTDGDLAAEYIREGAGADVSETDGPNYVLFSDDSIQVLIADDVMLIGTLIADVETAFQRDGTLAASDAFQTMLDAMPQDDYNIFTYVDATAINQAISDLVAATLSGQFGDEFAANTMGLSELMLSSAATELGQFAAGFTVIDERSPTVDIVASIPEDAMMLTASDLPPVDMNYAQTVPAEAEFVILGTNFGGQILAQFAALDQIMPEVQATLDAVLDTVAPEGEPLPEDVQFFLEDLIREAGIGLFIRPEDIVNGIRDIDLSVIQLGGVTENAITPIFAGFTGLNLRDDVLDWMTSDYAMWMSVYPVESDLDFTIDMGYSTAATSPEEAAYVVERLTQALDLYQLGHYVETLSNENDATDILVFTAPVRAITSAMLGGGAELDEILANTPELDLVFGANDNIFTFSSRPGAEFALNGGEDSLADDPAFIYAQENLFLDDANSILWVNTRPLADDVLEIYPALVATLGRDAEDLDDAVIILANVLESATVTTSMTDTISTARLTVTIPAEPYAEFNIMEMGTMGEPEPEVTVTLVGGRYGKVQTSLSEDGIPQFGDPDAPVTVELYESFSCPHCATFDAEKLGDLIDIAAEGKILVQFYPYEIFPTDPVATAAAACAGEQDLFWEMHDIIFELQRTEGSQAFNVASLIAAAAPLPLVDREGFARCVATGDTTLLDTGTAAGRAAGITGTPGIVINGTVYTANDLPDAVYAVIGE